MNARSLHGLIGILIAGNSLTAFGHHSVEASFDTDSPIELKGVVANVVWANPHAYLFLTVTNEDAAAESWAVELSPPHALARAGLSRESLATGDEIAITAFAQRADAPAGAQVSGFESVELANSLTAVLDRAIANRLVHATRMTLPDGRSFESDDTMWRQADTRQ